MICNIVIYTAPKEYLLLSQRSEISRLVMDSDTSENNDETDEVDNPEVTLPIQGLKNIQSLTYDPVQQHIFWVEGRQKNPKIIKRAFDNGTLVRIYIRVKEYFIYLLMYYFYCELFFFSFLKVHLLVTHAS